MPILYTTAQPAISHKMVLQHCFSSETPWQSAIGNGFTAIDSAIIRDCMATPLRECNNKNRLIASAIAHPDFVCFRLCIFLHSIGCGYFRVRDIFLPHAWYSLYTNGFTLALAHQGDVFHAAIILAVFKLNAYWCRPCTDYAPQPQKPHGHKASAERHPPQDEGLYPMLQAPYPK